MTSHIEKATGTSPWSSTTTPGSSCGPPPDATARPVQKFLNLLGEERCGQLELVSCEMAESIATAVSDRCPNAIRCVDPFHVIKLATDALDEIRREV